MKKTTKTQFKVFKKAFLEWQKRLGLTQYAVNFFHEKLDGFAQINIDEMNKAAGVIMTSEIEDNELYELFDPYESAKHEAIHLATHRLYWLGRQRCIGQSDLLDEWEGLTRRLQNTI